jgi:hypothetical protein
MRVLQTIKTSTAHWVSHSIQVPFIGVANLQIGTGRQMQFYISY